MTRREILWSNRGHGYSDEEIAAVTEAMKTADPLTQGKYLEAFERRFSEYLGVEHAFAVANCTNALDLSAALSRLCKDDEVVIPAHTWCSTAIAFARTGASIVWADIDPHTRTVTPETISAVISPRTKVVVVVHLYGLMAPMPEIMRMAEEYGFLVVEDCAQSIGADISGRKAGTFGDFACFSFHGAKNMSTLGEGGMLIVGSREDAGLVPGLRHNGLAPYPSDRQHYWIPAMSNFVSQIEGFWPYNFSLGEVQCAVGAKLLDRLDELTDKRNRRAQKFREALQDYPELEFQEIPAGYRHAYHLLAVRYRADKYERWRDDFIELIWRKYGVQAIVQYCPLYRYPLFVDNGMADHDCPNTDDFFDNMVSFPFHVWMSDDDFDYVIWSACETAEELRKGASSVCEGPRQA